MKKLTLIGLMILIGSITLCSVNTVKGLGSYFYYLIPDVEQDVKTFPDRLALQQQRYLELGTKPGGYSSFYISSSPINGNIISRHDLEFDSRGSTIVNNKVTQTSQNQDISFNNYCALKLGTINLGLTVGYSSYYSESDRNVFDENIYFNNHSYYTHADDSNTNRNIFSFGISTSIGKHKATSIAALYSTSTRESVVENMRNRGIWVDNIIDHEDSQLRESYDENEYQNFSVAIIHDFLKNKVASRLYSNFTYRIVDDSFENEISDVYSNYDSILTYQRENYNWNNQQMERKSYIFDFGYGINKNVSKLEMYGGVLFSVSYSDIEIAEEIIERSLIFENETTTGDTLVTTSSFKEKNYGSHITVPVGFVFKPYKWLRIFSSISLFASYNYKDVKDETYQNWTSKTGQNISFEILPYKNIEIGVYYINNLSDYHDWQINFKYSF